MGGVRPVCYRPYSVGTRQGHPSICKPLMFDLTLWVYLCAGTVHRAPCSRRAGHARDGPCVGALRDAVCSPLT
eukprot:scaffold57442_cov70-Phaeocystis_antarctica.AAC.7